MLLWRWRGSCWCERGGQEGPQVYWDVEKVWKLGDSWTVDAGRVGGDQSERLNLLDYAFFNDKKVFTFKEIYNVEGTESVRTLLVFSPAVCFPSTNLCMY